MLDDVLGIFSDSPKPDSAKQAASAPNKGASPEQETPSDTPAVYEARSDNTDLNHWLSAYLDERGVRDVAVFSLDGEVVGGRCEIDPRALRAALEELEESFISLGSELALGDIRLYSVELDGQVLVAARPTSEYSLAIILDVPSVLSLVMNRLRRDIPRVSEILSGPAFA